MSAAALSAPYAHACCLSVASLSLCACDTCAAAEHNGKSAHVVGVHSESGRYDAALSATQQLRLKRSNLRV